MVKQGWMCCLENATRLLSTGYIDNGRYTAALMIDGPTSLYAGAGASTLTAMARAMLPDGVVPQSGPPPTTPPPTTPPPTTPPPTTPPPTTPPPTTAPPTSAPPTKTKTPSASPSS
jgi:hypothetical protein